MTNSSKIKGNNFERELVNKAKSLGIDAKRAYASDGRSLGTNKEVDVVIGGIKIQAKRRRKLASFLTIPDGVDAVVIREDRGETYALIRLEDLFKIFGS